MTPQPYKKTPRKNKSAGSVHDSKSVHARSPVKRFNAAALTALKRKVGRPRKNEPIITVEQAPHGSTRVKEIIKVNVVPETPKKKGRVRGTTFEKGNPYAWKKGQSGNPRGKAKGNGITVISKAYTAKLSQKVAPEVAEALGFDPEHPPTWAEAMATGMITRAISHDTAAAKEVREVTEGRLPESLSVDGKIDYTAGETAKDRLMSKLINPNKNEPEEK